MKKILFINLIYCFLALGSKEDVSNSLNALENLINKVNNQVLVISKKIDQAREENEKIVEERLNSAIDVYYLLSGEVNDGIRNTVLNGITANKLTNKYQCIANVGEETLRKLNVTFERIPKVSDELKDKSIVPLRPYTVFLPGLEASLNDYMEIKAEEIREGTTEDEINSILEDVSKKMESLEEVLSTIDAKIDEAKYKFFEEYVDFTYATENSLRKDHLDGIKKIKKCIS